MIILIIYTLIIILFLSFFSITSLLFLTYIAFIAISIKDNINILLRSFYIPFSYLPLFTFSATLLIILTQSLILVTPTKSSSFSLLINNATNLYIYSYITLQPFIIITILNPRPQGLLYIYFFLLPNFLIALLSSFSSPYSPAILLSATSIIKLFETCFYILITLQLASFIRRKLATTPKFYSLVYRPLLALRFASSNTFKSALQL